MKVIASAAISTDGYLDDSSCERLVLSCPEDWAEVYDLRASCDAILVGAGTVRSDDPSLLIKDEQIRQQRISKGLTPDITKIMISGSAKVDITQRFFRVGECRKIVFVRSDADSVLTDNLRSVAEVICLSTITAQEIVRELAELGFERVMVEGGATVLKMFFDEDAIDIFRLAVSPLVVADTSAPRLYGAQRYIRDEDVRLKIFRRYVLGNMQIEWFERSDVHYLKMAVEQSRKCVPSTTSYCVGAVIVTASGELFEGYTHETSTVNHAEEEAIAKAVAVGANLAGSAIYSSLEPCSSRKSKPRSCSELIIEHGFAKVVFALYEPDIFADCVGAQMLIDAGLEVAVIDQLADQVKQINSHIIL